MTNNKDNDPTLGCFIIFIIIFISIILSIVEFAYYKPKPKKPINLDANKIGESVGKTTGKFSRGFFKGLKDSKETKEIKDE